VLVADDEGRITRLLQRVLEQQGYEVTVANDGREALRVLQREEFDSVILDLMMPYVNGYEILVWIKQHETKRHTWVALMTAQAEAMNHDESLAYRPDLYLSKPLEPTNLFR
jgi:DNA-binding response OmpR family regulator